jgi:hypothetical protein
VAVDSVLPDLKFLHNLTAGNCGRPDFEGPKTGFVRDTAGRTTNGCPHTERAESVAAEPGNGGKVQNVIANRQISA